MKKYLLLIFEITLFLFAFIFPSQSLAGIGASCNGTGLDNGVCGAGNICVNNTCENAVCQNSYSCSRGYTCTGANGVCVPQPCVSGGSYSVCTPLGLACNNNICVPKSQTKPPSLQTIEQQAKQAQQQLQQQQGKSVPSTVQCTCANPRIAGQGKNGYTCKTSVGSGRYNYSGACINKENGCFPVSGNVIHQQTVPVPCGTSNCPTKTINYVGVQCKPGIVAQKCQASQCTLSPSTCQQLAYNSGGSLTCVKTGCTNGNECILSSKPKTGVECRCAGPTQTRGGQKVQTSIQCINYTDTNPKWQKMSCGGAAICVQPSSLYYTWEQNGKIRVPGIACVQDCICQGTNGSPGSKSKTGDGNNGKQCYTSNGSLGAVQTYCTNREDYCQNDPLANNRIKCVNSSKCTCSADKKQINCVSKGSGPNGADENQSFSCNGGQCITGSNVNDPNFKFANQHISGIKCTPPKPPPTLPPPPSPPCEHWANGQCTTFTSALGQMSTNPDGFIKSIFGILLSISGGIALLLIIKAGYQLMTSQGKPEQIQQGRDQLIAAIVGLIFLIFSFVFLQLIGYDILHIYGFGGSSGTSGTCAPGTCMQTSLCTAKSPGRCNSNGCPSGQSCVQ